MVGKEREERSKCEREREVEEDEVRYGVEGCITPVHAMASMCQGQEAWSPQKNPSLRRTRMGWSYPPRC